MRAQPFQNLTKDISANLRLIASIMLLKRENA
jgi:hypothetical protein